MTGRYDKASPEACTLLEQFDEFDLAEMLVTAQAAIARVRALHQPMQRGALTVCAHCSQWDKKRQRCFGALTDYPCSTIAALDGHTKD